LVLGQAAVAVLIAATAWAAGASGSGMLVGRVSRRGSTPHEPMPWVLTMALGFAVIGQVLTLVGLIGLLRKPVVLAIAIVIHIAAIPGWRRVLSARPAMRAWRAEAFAGAGVAGVGGVMTIALTTVCLLTAFFLTLYPPLGFDQTMYHLPHARAFAASGELPFLPALRYPMFPPLAEVLNAAVLMFAGDVATQAAGWVALVACAGLAYTWARDLAAGASPDVSTSPSARAGGLLAVAAIVGSPIALYLAATGYVEPLLALLGGASLYAAERARINTDATDGRWLVMAGVLAGSAASVKYLGLYFVPAAALLLISKRTPRRVMLRALVIYGVAAAAALLPCYGRLVLHTGNPVFPFYPELFGANPWGAQVLMGPNGEARWWRVLTRLWDVTFRRDASGGLPHFSPAFVFALPVIALAAWRHHRFRLLLLIAIGYLLAAPTHAHYLLTTAVLWCALFGASAATLLRARQRAGAAKDAGAGVLIAVAVLLASGGEAYALYRLHRLGPPPVTSEARDRLIARERPLYPAIAWLNRRAGPVTLYAVNAELMVDYAAGTLLGDFNGPASFDRMEARVRTTGSISAALDTIGASHLLLAGDAPFWRGEASRDPRLTRVYGDDHAVMYRVASTRGTMHQRR
jgi:hypothetical protein